MDKNTKIGIALGTILALFTGTTMFAYADALTRQLEMGMTGEDVGMLQRFLATDGEIYPEGIVSNYFGQLTKNAVMKYQTKNGIAPVGRVGPQTMTFINSQMSNSTSTNATTSSTTTGASASGTSGMLLNFNSGSPIYGVVANSENGIVTLTWMTAKPSKAIVYYDKVPLKTSEGGNGVDISGTAINVDTYNTKQSVKLPAIESGSVYYFSIQSIDQNGEMNMTWPASVTVK